MVSAVAAHGPDRPSAGAARSRRKFLRFFPGGFQDETYQEWERAYKWEADEPLPRKQTRVLTWPLATVFGFLAQPDRHFFLKPNVTRQAARAYGV